jgi:uncharacterized Zn-finger protein
MNFQGKWIDKPEMAMNTHEYAKSISPTEVNIMYNSRYCGSRHGSKSAYYDYIPTENYYQNYSGYKIPVPEDFRNIYGALYAAVNIPTHSTPTHHIQTFIPEEIPFVVFNDEMEDVPDLDAGNSPSEIQDSSPSDSSQGTTPIESQTQDLNLENIKSEPEAESISPISDEKTPKIFECQEKVRMPINNQNCKKVFDRKAHLKRHLKIHSGIRPFVCLVADCPKSFVRRDNMLHHSKNHANSLGIVLSDELIESTKVTPVRFKFLENSPFL